MAAAQSLTAAKPCCLLSRQQHRSRAGTGRAEQLAARMIASTVYCAVGMSGIPCDSAAHVAACFSLEIYTKEERRVLFLL